MRNNLLTFLICLTSSAGFTQNCGSLSVSSISHKIITDGEDDINFINLCVGDIVNFKAESQNNSADYKWYIDDEEKSSKEEFSHTFKESDKGYIIKLSDQTTDCSEEILIRVASEPTINITPDRFYACPGIEITLGTESSNELQFSKEVALNPLGKSPTCHEEVPDSLKLPDGLDRAYESSTEIICYGDTMKFHNVDYIDSVFIEIEHSFMGDLDIYLTAPNGAIVTLFEAAGDDTWFGEAIDDESTEEAGKGYHYGWSANPNYKGTMAQGVLDNTTTFILTQTENVSILNPDIYYPIGDFDSFIGSLLNGIWKITIVDTRLEDNGWIFKWGIKFKDELMPTAWVINNSIDSEKLIPDSISNNSDQSIKIIPSIGENKYVYEVKDTYDCYYTKALTVLGSDVKAHFEPSRNKVENSNAIVDFNNLSTSNTDDINYYWDFGNGDYSYDDNPQYNFFAIDTHKVQLTVTNQAGCTDTYSRDIITEEDYIVWTPTAFTPNGDGINDSFKLILERTKRDDYILFIYDAWGKLVFETNDIDEAWDGKRKDNGIIAESGNYTYLCQFITNQNKSQEKIGSFFLME